jgi:hypothetical protein
MGQNGIARRLDALEQIAVDIRRREVREWLLAEVPEGYVLSPAEIDEGVEEALCVLEVTAAWRRAGLTGCEIMRRGTKVYGLDLGAIEAEYRRLV